MKVINVRNVNSGLSSALSRILHEGEKSDSRNGPVLRFPEPVATTYTRPTERVLFSPVRNANPVFHLMESLWMLAGRNDLAFPATFVKNMKNFSDDGNLLFGAYGSRWRRWFGYDQLMWIIDELKVNPNTRRAVLSMWDPGSNAEEKELQNDLYVASHGGKDVPCNTHIYFDCRGGRLNMTVCNRSNDIVWGCYGANAVHMSILQEYVAHAVGIPVGRYTQFSNDLHLYLELFEKRPAPIGHTFSDPTLASVWEMAQDAARSDKYASNVCAPLSLIKHDETVEQFDEDLKWFFTAFDGNGIELITTTQFNTDFFNFTVNPMLAAWRNRKNLIEAQSHCTLIESPDWWIATCNWLDTNHGGAH